MDAWALKHRPTEWGRFVDRAFAQFSTRTAPQRKTYPAPPKRFRKKSLCS